MTVQFGSITIVTGDPVRVGERLKELHSRKGISLMAHHNDRGVVVDGRDAMNFLADRLDLYDLPVRPFLLNKDTFEKNAKAKEVLTTINDAVEAEGFKSLEDVCDRWLYDRSLQRLEDGIDADGKPVREEEA